MMMWLWFSMLRYSESLKECGRNIAEVHHTVKIFSMKSLLTSAVQLSDKYNG